MRNSFIVGVFLIIICPGGQVSQLAAQALQPGLPFVQNYSKETYGAGTQNWAIAQDDQGRMFFANNDGLLEFNGNSWHLTPLPNRTILRSLVVAPNGRIFVGGQDELGYFLADAQGRWRFHSLKPRLPEAFRQFEDVWNLHLLGEELWASTRTAIFRIGPDTAEAFPATGSYDLLANTGATLWAFDSGRGLLRWDGQAWQLLPSSDQLVGSTVSSLVQVNGRYWIGTVYDGLFLLEEDNIRPMAVKIRDYLRDHRIHAITPLTATEVAIGTANHGLLVVDTLGNPRLQLQHRNGLQNNHVISLYVDRTGNLWCGLNNGIDFLETHSPFRRIMPDEELLSAGYSAAYVDNTWYFGTANGLYRHRLAQGRDPFPDRSYQLLAGSEGQVWGLQPTAQGLLMGHHEGTFQIEERSRPLHTAFGYWDFLKLPGHPDVLVGGSYEGLALFRRDGDQWRFWRMVPGLVESSRLLAVDPADRVWMAHPYRGVFSIDFSESLVAPTIHRYGAADGLPSDNANQVFRIFDEVCFGTVQGVYRFDAAKERFVPDSLLNTTIGRRGWIKLMKQDQQGNIWFALDEEVGYLTVQDQGLAREVACHWLPRLSRQLVAGHEFLLPVNRDYVIFGTDQGFISYQPEYAWQSQRPFSVLISQVWLLSPQDSLLFGGHFPAPAAPAEPIIAPPELSSDQHSFRFQMAATRFGYDRVTFRYFLEGFDDGWLSWTEKPEKEYTQLPPGSYTFWVQARDSYGQATEPLAYAFTILPPWYLSQTARVLYLLLLVAAIASLLLIPQQKFRKEKDKLKSDMRRQDAARQQEIEALRTKSLQAEIQHNNQQLASATMHLVQKNEMLVKMKEELQQLEKELNETSSRKRVRSLVRMLNEEEQLDRDWEQFAYHFDQVHSDFLKRLGEAYPQLTPKDHRLCAYLRMNLSTKEIAPLMNISVRGVEISRYRLRKKLDLDHDENLNEFMMKF